MEHYIGRCSVCKRSYSFIGIKSAFTEEQRIKRKLDDTVCKLCGAKGNLKVELDFGENESTESVRIVIQTLKENLEKR